MLNLSLDFNLLNNDYYFYERLLVLLVSLVPTFFLVGFVLYTDRKSKEPTKNIVICLLSGILTTALSQYLEGLVMPYFSNNVILTYIWATIEELSKIAIFFLFIFDNKHYDDIFDGVVYMTLIALSFAGIENIMYAFSESTISNSIGLALIRDLTTIPLHVICGVVIGYFLSIGNFSKDKVKKKINFALAFIIPSIIHGTFNNLITFIGDLKIDYTNAIQVLLLEVFPILVIMIILFYIAAKFSKKAVTLNEVFVKNGEYDMKHSYLMTYNEFIDSYDRRRRIMMSDKTKLFNKKEDSFNRED